MQELYICITICLTIIIVFFLLTHYNKKDSKINKVIEIKNKNLKFDKVYINIHSDGKLTLDYYDYSIDDEGL